MSEQITRAAGIIAQGGLVIYPTETLYALGASIAATQAVEHINRLKQRDANKPLPVIIGALDQLKMVTDWEDSGFSRLMRNFWPGPLSILVPARPGVPAPLQDPQGFVALRWTSHPTAQALAVQSRAPLVSTSANPGGGPAAGRPQDLDPNLVQKVGMVIDLPPYPAGGKPSSVVQILADNRLKIFREGAVAITELRASGWQVG